MVKELVTYPDERIKITSADVRKFDEELFTLIENMKDTMDANGLDALSAIQIAVPATVVLVRHDGELLELINPRIIGSEGTVESTETTAYLPGITATVTRYDKIKLIYQDRSGLQHSMDVDGKLSSLIQRKIDYTFGGTFVDKLDKKGRKRVEKEAEAAWGAREAASCPTRSKRGYFTRVIRLLLWTVGLSLFAPLLTDDINMLENVYTLEKGALGLNSVLIIGYFFYAQYEARQSRSCTSCQTGNIIGTALIAFVMTLLLLGLSFLFVNPA